MTANKPDATDQLPAYRCIELMPTSGRFYHVDELSECLQSTPGRQDSAPQEPEEHPKRPTRRRGDTAVLCETAPSTKFDAKKGDYMTILTDNEILDLIVNNKNLIDLSDSEIKTFKERPLDKGHPVQPSSLDLKIGRIFVPEEKVDLLPKRHPLQPGETALVETKETLDLPGNIAGIGFPPSHVSIDGILMTNPGHLDPGYQGPMRFTVINMGKKTFELRQGDTIVSVIFFKMNNPSQVDYRSRNKKVTPAPRTAAGGMPNRADPVVKNILDRLTKDFMNISKRAKDAATARIGWLGFAGVTLAALITAVVSQYENPELQSIKEKIVVLEEKLNASDTKSEVNSLSQKITSLSQKNTDMESRLSEIENKNDSN